MAEPHKVYLDDNGNPVTRVKVDENGNLVTPKYEPTPLSFTPASRATADSEPPARSSAAVEALSHLAHPKSVGDFMSLVAPEVGMETWVPGVRMAKTALRFAAAEPKGAGIVGRVTGAVRGALRGAYREAVGPGIQQESPRLVKAGADQPVPLAIGRARAPLPPSTKEAAGTFRDSVEEGLAAALDKAPNASGKLSDLDKAIVTAKQQAADTRAASGRREDRMVRAEQTADTQDVQRVARQEKLNKKALDEAERADIIAEARGEPKRTKFRTTLSAPTAEGGRQSMSTTYKGAAKVGSDPLPPEEFTEVPFKTVQTETPPPQGRALRIVAKSAPKVAPYTHHSTDSLPRFNVEGSDVTAAEAAARGYQVGEIPAGAGKASSTAARDAALARQAARVKSQQAAAAPAPVSPPITLDPTSVQAVGGGELSSIEEEALRRALKIAPGIRVTGLTPKGEAAQSTLERLRTQLGAERAGQKMGVDTNAVRGVSGGPAGLAPTRMMAAIDQAMADMSPMEMAAYLKKAPNATAYNYIESVIKSRTP